MKLEDYNDFELKGVNMKNNIIKSAFALLSVFSLCSCSAEKPFNPKVLSAWHKYESSKGDVFYLLGEKIGCGHFNNVDNGGHSYVFFESESGLLEAKYWMETLTLESRDTRKFDLKCGKNDEKTLIAKNENVGKITFTKKQIPTKEMNPNTLFALRFYLGTDELLPTFHEDNTITWDGRLFLSLTTFETPIDLPVATTFIDDSNFSMSSPFLEDPLVGTYTMTECEMRFRFTSECADSTLLTMNVGPSFQMDYDF